MWRYFCRIMPLPRRSFHVKRSLGDSDYTLKNYGIRIGQVYWVKRRNTWALVEVLNKRSNKKKKCCEYYIKYQNLNRRLDEWVPGYRLKLDPGLKDTTDKPREPPLTYDSEESLESEIDSNEEEYRATTRVKNINCIQLGIYEINVWYYSPYPDGFNMKDKLFICDKCFKYMCSRNSYVYHQNICSMKKPPGLLVYQNDKLAIFEVDGFKNQLYCQNLSLMAKLFIDHKTICYDVESFMFYILCEEESKGFFIRGYFSKEKDDIDDYNLSCIMILPPHQKRGFGKLLIDFSYKLSLKEGKIGSPEGPISDLGFFMYQSYWNWIILSELNQTKGSISLKSLSSRTGIAERDIISTLETLKLMNYWRGSQEICIQPKKIASLVKSGLFKIPTLTVDESCLSLDHLNH